MFRHFLEEIDRYMWLLGAKIVVVGQKMSYIYVVLKFLCITFN